MKYEEQLTAIAAVKETLPKSTFSLKRLPGRFRMAPTWAWFVHENEVHVVIGSLQKDGQWLQAWRGPEAELRQEIATDDYAEYVAGRAADPRD